MFAHDVPDLFQFKTPSVRHLAWLCQASQLLQHHNVFYPAAHLPAGYVATLQEWDNNPATRPDLLNTTPHYRLGYYVETLYACLIQDLLGWTILARNLPVRAGGLTLGELDFLIHNSQTNAVEHHEIAVKFYLGYDGCVDGAKLPPGWYGPNPRDRLDIKTARMLEQQSQRSLLPETGEVLARLGIAQPAISRVFMPGYLFYPKESANHFRGRWMYVDDMAATDTSMWVPLVKPHWLGPWVQSQTPDKTDTIDALAAVVQTQTPRLFAILGNELAPGLWKESDRVFVVPPQWPRPASSTTA